MWRACRRFARAVAGTGARMDACNHAGYHSGQSRYTLATEELRYVVVCEACGDEVRLVESVAYRPDPRLEAVSAPDRAAA